MSDLVIDRVGFTWGPGRVVRLYDDDKCGVVFEIGGQRQCVEVRVTPSGLVRIGAINNRTVLGGRR